MDVRDVYNLVCNIYTGYRCFQSCCYEEAKIITVGSQRAEVSGEHDHNGR